MRLAVIILCSICGFVSTAEKSMPAVATMALQRPNYTMPVCQVAQKGVWRAPLIRPRRIMVVGMQSSGASTFLFLLAQLPRTVAVVDLWVGRPAPRPEDLDLATDVEAIVLKVTINAHVSVDQYLQQFQPDFSIL